MTMLDQLPTARRAVGADRPMLTRILADAFNGDPVFEWLVPDLADRRRRIGPMLDALVDAVVRHDETHVVPTADVVAAVAVWAPPGSDAVHPDDEDAVAERVAELAGPHLDRLDVCLELFAAVRPEEPAWFLNLLAVDPLVQGMGLGSVALRSVLARADDAGEPAYVVATSVRNRTLFERHGFGHLADIVLPGGPTTYAMWREPVVDTTA